MLLQDIFIDRKKELFEISIRITLEQNPIIIAPRFYGKTTLIKKIAKNRITTPLITLPIFFTRSFSIL